MLTVKEVITKLQEFNPDTPLAIYVNEEIQLAFGIKLEQKGQDLLYCQGCHILDEQYGYKKCLDFGSVVVIGDFC